MFAHKHPPRGQHEVMTLKDPLDYVDFAEVSGLWQFSCPCSIKKSCFAEHACLQGVHQTARQAVGEEGHSLYPLPEHVCIGSSLCPSSWSSHGIY